MKQNYLQKIIYLNLIYILSSLGKIFISFNKCILVQIKDESAQQRRKVCIDEIKFYVGARRLRIWGCLDGFFVGDVSKRERTSKRFSNKFLGAEILENCL